MPSNRFADALTLAGMRIRSLFGVARDELSGTLDDWKLGLHPEDLERTLGEITVSVGGSPPATMCRTQIIVPTFPYPGCGAPAPVDLLPRPPSVPYYPRLCRQFGLYCGH